MEILTGIDLSQHNGNVDFAKVAKSGVKFAILRTGYGRNIPKQRDKKFEAYYSGCKANGIPVGAYHYSYATTAAGAAEEAAFVLEILKGKKLEYPIYFDIEEKAQCKLPKAVCDEMVTTFCTILEKAGYFAGVYSFDSFFNSNLSTAIVQRFSAWAARVENIKPTSCKAYGMHQYSWKGKVDGCNGDVDMNYCYKDFPAVIKSKRLNGYNT